jgi:hypothetical protein
MADSSGPLLNVYAVETENEVRSFICFLDPILAGVKGIEPHAVIGPYDATEDEPFDPLTFQVNPAFVDSITAYMNNEGHESEALIAQASEIRSDWLYVLDPRDPGDGADEPPTVNVLGAFPVDDTGQIVPNSFQYNKNHRIFDVEFGTSGMLYDQKFYRWLHEIEDRT